MKNAITLLFALITYSANAQFTLLPQIGMESSRTTIKSSEFAAFSPKGMQFAPLLAARLGYSSKSGHGAFLGVATSSPSVQFNFTDPQTARSSYKASAEDLQLRLEGGYQYVTKPIALSKPGNSNKYGHRACGGQQHTCAGHTNCHQNTASHCGKSAIKSASQSKGWFMRIKPSAGLAFLPSENEIETETKAGQTNYEYKAGWNTALIAGTAFEFGTRKESRFVVSINYLKSLGSNSQTLNTVNNNKSTAYTFQSNTSSFNVSIGIPINLKKKSTVTPPSQHKQCNGSHMSRCGQYRMFYQQ